MSPENYPIEEIEVFIAHPMVSVWLPLADWIKVGPGRRRLVCPLAARNKNTHALLPHELIPIQYRNDREARRLIREGVLPDPWSHIAITGFSRADIEQMDREADEILEEEYRKFHQTENPEG